MRLPLAAVVLASTCFAALAQQSTPDAEAQARERAAAEAAIAACDVGASAPGDADTRAAPVLMLDFMSRRQERAAHDEIKAACAAATVAEPNSERLRYQHLRVLYLDPDYATSERPGWLETAMALAAKTGRADAQFLHFFELDLKAVRSPEDGEAASEAIATLRAAAAQGHVEALDLLMRKLADRDSYFPYAPREAVAIADRLAQGAPAPPTPRSDAVLPRLRYAARYEAARIRLSAPGFEPAEQAAGFATLKEMADAGDSLPILPLARALRAGEGAPRDPVAARAMLERADSGPARVELAEMLLAGEGGPADRARALTMLKDDRLGWIGKRNRLLADVYLGERFPGPDPRAALTALERSSTDIESDLRRAALLAQTKLPARDAKDLTERLSRAARNGMRGAALALARLAFADHSSLRDLAVTRAALAPFAAQGDREARLMLARAQFDNLFSTSYRPNRSGDLGDDDIRAIIAEGVAAGSAQAFLLRGQLQRRGALYAQDDRAATQDIVRAAELGDLQAMHLAGKAYDDGLGVQKNARERLRWWREGAKRGHLDSRESLAGAFTFDSFDRLMTLREGVTEPIILWANGLGFRYGDSLAAMNQMSMSSLFGGGRIREAPASAIAAAILEGLRLAPAGAQDARLVQLGRGLPAELRLEIERALAKAGHLKEAPDGYFGPQARAAVAAFVEKGEPLAAAAAPAPVVAAQQTAAAPAATPAGAPATGGLDKATLDRARDVAFKAAIAAKTDKERRAAVAGLAALARYGDTPARWALMRNYHQSTIVRQAISAEELTRFALDVLATKPEGAQKADFEFIFNVSRLYQDRKLAVFARAFVEAMRDDSRLRDPLELGGLLGHARMAPGACDALAAEAKRLKIAASEDCAGPIVEALIAHATKAGPAGVEAKARQAAEAGVRALAK
ncbi:MAG: SEL1-like repeat protein [Methylobacteriaceae bacterium]|nr:SEL1-like repeat protein [Methylobacteriaceae bacterium]